MLVRNETDSRITMIKVSEVSLTAAAATQLTPVDMGGLQAAALYFANFCTAAVHYDVKGSYAKDAATAYWYSITSGTAAVNAVTCIGAFGGAGNISALGNHHKYITVEYFASVTTSGNFIMQLAAW